MGDPLIVEDIGDLMSSEIDFVGSRSEIRSFPFFLSIYMFASMPVRLHFLSVYLSTVLHTANKREHLIASVFLCRYLTCCPSMSGSVYPAVCSSVFTFIMSDCLCI